MNIFTSVCGAILSFVLLAASPIQAAGPAPALSPENSKFAIPPLRTGAKTLASTKQLAAKATKSLGSKSIHTTGTKDAGAGCWFALNLEFENAEACRTFKVEGTHLITRFDRFADIFAAADYSDDLHDYVIPPDLEQEISNAPGMVWYDIASDTFLPPMPREPINEETAKGTDEPDRIALGGVGPYAGKGVIIAVIDTGIDFRHPDFIAKDSAGNDVSRLLYFWDTTSEQYKSGKIGTPAPYTYPNDKPGRPSQIGTIFSREELTRNLRTPNPEIPEWDTNGHGTGCLGVAAGNGHAGPKDKVGNSRYAGVAPDADLIAVRIATGETLENAYLLGAVCEWLNRVAGDRPLVISCSFAGHSGGHDGYLVEERQLDARFPSSAKGRAICIAAGNEGKEHFHADLAIGGKDKPAVLRWTAKHGTELKVYFQTSAANDLEPDEEETYGINREGVDAVLHPLTHQAILSLFVISGDGQLSLHTKSGRTILADAYLVPGVGAEFEEKENDAATAGLSQRNQVGTPGSCMSAITVGSYDWNDRFDRFGKLGRLPPAHHSKTDMQIGGLSDYSNPGYLRIGDVVKPDIISPGQWFTTPAAINVPADRDSTGLYKQFAGTSAATPYTAGVIALLMQKTPSITLGEIKIALQKSATPPSKRIDPLHASPLPNPYWGYGKLDRAAVERMLNVKP